MRDRSAGRALRVMVDIPIVRDDDPLEIDRLAMIVACHVADSKDWSEHSTKLYDVPGHRRLVVFQA